MQSTKVKQDLTHTSSYPETTPLTFQTESRPSACLQKDVSPSSGASDLDSVNKMMDSSLREAMLSLQSLSLQDLAATPDSLSERAQFIADTSGRILERLNSEAASIEEAKVLFQKYMGEMCEEYDRRNFCGKANEAKRLRDN